jgi:hypothetical protein
VNTVSRASSRFVAAFEVGAELSAYRNFNLRGPNWFRALLEMTATGNWGEASARNSFKSEELLKKTTMPVVAGG